MSDILTFAISFAIGMLYYRVLFKFNPGYFNKPFTRTLLRLQFHHSHFGTILVLIATFILLTIGLNIYVIILLGLGLGLIYDLFIWSLMMKGDRPVELNVYKKSLSSTLIMGAIIIGFIYLLDFLI